MFCQTQPHHVSSFQPFTLPRSHSSAHRCHPNMRFTFYSHTLHQDPSSLCLSGQGLAAQVPEQGQFPYLLTPAMPAYTLPQASHRFSLNSFLGRFFINRMQRPAWVLPLPTPSPPIEKSSVMSILSRQMTVTRTEAKDSQVYCFRLQRLQRRFGSLAQSGAGRLSQFWNAGCFKGYKHGQSPGWRQWGSPPWKGHVLSIPEEVELQACGVRMAKLTSLATLFCKFDGGGGRK